MKHLLVLAAVTVAALSLGITTGIAGATYKTHGTYSQHKDDSHRRGHDNKARDNNCTPKPTQPKPPVEKPDKPEKPQKPEKPVEQPPKPTLKPDQPVTPTKPTVPATPAKTDTIKPAAPAKAVAAEPVVTELPETGSGSWTFAIFATLGSLGAAAIAYVVQGRTR